MSLEFLNKNNRFIEMECKRYFKEGTPKFKDLYQQAVLESLLICGSEKFVNHPNQIGYLRKTLKGRLLVYLFKGDLVYVPRSAKKKGHKRTKITHEELFDRQVPDLTDFFLDLEQIIFSNEEREIIRLSICGYTFREIAIELKITVSRVVKIKKELKERYEKIT